MRLRVNDVDTLARRRTEIDRLLADHGLKLIGQGMIRYSEEGCHGYTYMTGLLQSGAMIHTYPEADYQSATFMIETCEPERAMRHIVRTVVQNLAWFYGAKATILRTGSRPLPLKSGDVPIGTIPDPQFAIAKPKAKTHASIAA